MSLWHLPLNKAYAANPVICKSKPFLKQRLVAKCSTKITDTEDSCNEFCSAYGRMTLAGK